MERVTRGRAWIVITVFVLILSLLAGYLLFLQVLNRRDGTSNITTYETHTRYCKNQPIPTVA